MNVLKFKKGYKQWDTTFEAELDFEYSEDLKRHITALILYRPDIGRRVVLPWRVFDLYSTGKAAGAFVDQTGLKVLPANGNLRISSRNFNLVLQNDQVNAIHRAASNLASDISSSVENILAQSCF